MSWHAAVVHLPIGLAFVWPVVDLVGLLLGRPAVSWTGVGLLVACLVGSLVATATGQAEYDAAYAAGFAVELLDTHADFASLVPWVLLAVTAIRLWAPTKIGRAGHGIGIGLGFLFLALVIQTGRTGGALVYEHGVGVAPDRAPAGELDP